MSRDKECGWVKIFMVYHDLLKGGNLIMVLENEKHKKNYQNSHDLNWVPLEYNSQTWVWYTSIAR